MLGFSATRGKSYPVFALLGLLLTNGGYSQEIHATFGIQSFDKEFAFASAPQFGLGVGHDITHGLQLNLSLVMTPTQQRISAATQPVEHKVTVVHYALGIRLSRSVPRVRPLRVFAQAAFGGLIFRSGGLRLELQPGTAVYLAPRSDHRFGFALGGGLRVPLRAPLALLLEYRGVWHHAPALGRTVRHDYLGTGLALRL